MVMSSLSFLFAEHIPEWVLEKPASLEIPMGTYRKRPSKNCSFEPKDQETAAYKSRKLLENNQSTIEEMKAPFPPMPAKTKWGA